MTDGDRTLLEGIAQRRTRRVPARHDVIAEGEPPRFINVVVDGWGCRYKQLPNGSRQMLSLLLPGDTCDANAYILREMDHSIGAITNMTIAEVHPEEFMALVQGSPNITKALWWNEMVMMAIQREWTLSLGQRSARERIAHLLCEIFFRLKVIGRCAGNACEFPLTQIDLADATGLTSVHVNRMLQDLRRENMIELSGKALTILDMPALMEEAMFNPNYLHLDSGDARRVREN
ncbi:Crp/Fnr family transcriptional regulator [Sphingomonas naphthae]|uniref:Crp/Fnr family transcriptional regulator n=1 Tax=Sphingomonas naphthae TaxID=1813468 RepID=A0ABY7TGD5_9SPHN|nr:Crp/Fnr family transcriptional regulator [Sphingomonas naphthae]WCT72286.1 Crp/Fnr family transcriptional regulator [Sphingomonas naphthae]